MNHSLKSFKKKTKIFYMVSTSWHVPNLLHYPRGSFCILRVMYVIIKTTYPLLGYYKIVVDNLGSYYKWIELVVWDWT